MDVQFHYDHVEINGIRYEYTSDEINKMLCDAKNEVAAIKRVLPMVENVLDVSEKSGKKREFLRGVLTVMAVIQSRCREAQRVQDVIENQMYRIRYNDLYNDHR